MKHADPKLCPDCPLPDDYKKDVVVIFKKQQYTRIKEDPSALKECRARRHMLKILRLNPCPYFNETESIKLYF